VYPRSAGGDALTSLLFRRGPRNKQNIMEVAARALTNIQGVDVASNSLSDSKQGCIIVSQANPSRALEPVIVASEQAAEEVEVLQASIKAGTVAQIVVAVIAVIGLIYLLKLVLVTTLASMLLAFMLEPAVKWLAMLRIPRWMGALIVVLLTLVVIGGLVYFSYNSALQFADQLPEYSARIRGTFGRIRERTDRMAEQARLIVGQPKNGEQPVPVKIEQLPGVAGVISRNTGTILDVVLAGGFVPFLVYFMLTLKEHTHVATVRLFPKEHRLLAHRTVGRISGMIRSYIVANVLVGLLNAVLCTLLFWSLGIKYSYFLGALSGFVGIVPYLGVFGSLLPPLAAGIDTLDKTGIVIVIVALIGLHVLTMNVLYPKFVGKRLRLNPLGVSLSLLFWAWIWGPPGLILAIPLLGALKIICDYVEPLQGLGSWLGESLT
jgi:predicted PurR-regulated permease PerM